MSTQFEASKRPLFHATLRPIVSASLDAQTILLSIFALLSIGLAAVFVVLGLWLLTPFILLDAGLLAVAFRAFNARRRQIETLEVHRDRVTITRFNGQAELERIELPTAWSRLEVDADPTFGCLALSLCCRQKRYAIGAAISAAQRRALAKDLELVLERARYGGVAVWGAPTEPALDVVQAQRPRAALTLSTPHYPDTPFNPSPPA